MLFTQLNQILRKKIKYGFIIKSLKIFSPFNIVLDVLHVLEIS